MSEMESLFGRAMGGWAEVSARYGQLADAPRASLTVEGYSFKVVLNPTRSVSTLAKVDARSIASRPCFLCPANQPAEQEALRWQGYKIQVNPFPIFSTRHFTISSLRHEPQQLAPHFADMVALARQLPGYVVFYNGAGAGASAPDHLHFQAGPAAELPLCSSERWIAGERHRLEVGTMPGDDTALAALTGIIAEAERQSPINVVGWADEQGGVEVHLFRRRCHRPACYGAEPGQLLVSPGSIDLAGLVTVIRQADFAALTAQPALLAGIVAEVTR